MILQLKELFEIDGESRDISCEIPLSYLAEVNSYDFSEPVKVRGRVFNRAGVVTLEYDCEFTLDQTCDRCLKEFKREYGYSFEHILVRRLNNDNDEYVVCLNNTLDLNELAVSDILLNLPTKTLCRQDCRGLCCVCGADLNEGDCEHTRSDSSIIS